MNLDHIVKAGYDARAQGKLRAPAVSEEFEAALEGSQIGDGRIQIVSAAWQKGWMLHEAEELAELGLKVS